MISEFLFSSLAIAIFVAQGKCPLALCFAKIDFLKLLATFLIYNSM